MSEARTGIENYLHHLLPGLAARWRALGGEVVVFAANPAVVAHVDPPVRVLPGGGRGWTQLRLPGALRAAGVDVYFTPIPVLPLLLPLPCPSVVTVHDLLEFRPRWWYFRRLIGHTLDHAAAAICVSQATQAEVAEAFPRAAARTLVVREAADPAVFHKDRGRGGAADQLLQRLGITRPPIVAVGTIQPRKNYARLIDAYARATAALEEPPQLVIVGRRGWEFEDVLALPAALGIEARVLFAGHLSELEVGELLRHALMLAAVSLGEGFGLPLVEAMYSGLPVLAADIPAFREVAGNAALFVNPLSADDIAAGLRRLLDSTTLREELRLVGRARRSMFSWDRASEEVCATLRSALTAI